MFSRFVARARTMNGLQTSSKVLQCGHGPEDVLLVSFRQRREHRQTRNFSIDRLGVRAEAGLVTKPFAIEAVVVDRSVMHVRADAGGLEMIEGAALDGAAGAYRGPCHRHLESGAPNPEAGKAFRVNPSTRQFNLKML